MFDDSLGEMATTVFLFVLDLIAPLSILYAIYTAASAIMVSTSLNLGLLPIYAFAETAFYLAYLYRRKSLVSQLAVDDDISTEARISDEDRRRFWADAMYALDQRGTGRKGVEDWLQAWFVHPAPRAPRRSGWLLGRMRSALEYAGFISEETGEGDVGFQEIRRGNIEELLAGTFFHQPLAQVISNPLSHHSLISMVLSLEHRRNHRFVSGYNSSISPLTPQVHGQHLQSTHRPLMVYLVVTFGEALMAWSLWILGFKSFRSPVPKSPLGSSQPEGLGYAFHPGWNSPSAGIICFLWNKIFRTGAAVDKSDTGKQSSNTPVIFIHGLGGPAPTLHLIVALITLGQPIFVLSQPHLSLQLTLQTALHKRSYKRRLTLREMAEAVDVVLDEHGFVNRSKSAPAIEKGFDGVIIAHSLGSALASALNNNSVNETITKRRFKTILIDPISLHLHNAHLARTIYTRSGLRTGRGGPMSKLVSYFTKEMGVANYLGREFNPFEAALYLYPNTQGYGGANATTADRADTTVILGRNDHLIPVNDIAKACDANGAVECRVLENTGHGGWLFSLPLFLDVFETIRTILCSINNSESLTERQKCEMQRTNTIHALQLGMSGNPTVISSPSLVRGPTMVRLSSRATIEGSCVPSRTRSRTLCVGSVGSGVTKGSKTEAKMERCLSGASSRSRSRTVVQGDVIGVWG